jgi:uncharacterized repeat protein (TIGR01451 family)
MKIRIFFLLLFAYFGIVLFSQSGVQAGQIITSGIQVEVLSKFDTLVLSQLDSAGKTDFFVIMEEQADLSAVSRIETKDEKGKYVFETLVATADRTQLSLRSYLDSQGVEYTSFYIVNAILVKDGSIAQATVIASRPDVSGISANHNIQLDEPINSQVTTDEPQTVEPNLTFINVPQVWAMGVNGSGTVMAGNDTGLDETHPAIAPHYRGCLNPPNCNLWDYNYSWWDATGTYPNNPYDGHGHGTHTTGTMIGDDSAGNQIGIAPGAQTIHCKNMTDDGIGDDFTFLTCFEWDLAPWDLNHTNPRPNLAPDVVNNSWGYFGGGNDIYRMAIDNLQNAGILVEASAGNEGPTCSTLHSPGDYQEVLTVGSIDYSGLSFPGIISNFSSRGPSVLDPSPPSYFPDIMAPGNGIRSSLPGNQYASWGGTSMAGSHVSGVVGLIWSACPTLRGMVSETIDILKQTSAPLSGQNGSNCGGNYTDGPNNDWGFGTINAEAAVSAAIEQCTGIGGIGGTITDGLTNEPIPSAEVSAALQSGHSWSGITNPLGFYALTVPSGIYTITVEQPLHTLASEFGVIVITDTVTMVDIQMMPKGHLNGYVTDIDNGIPLSGVTITSDDGGIFITDQDGHYELYLDEGRHNVAANIQGYFTETKSVDIIAGQLTQLDFNLNATIGFVPLPINVTVDWQSTLDLTATLINRLPVPFEFSFFELAGGNIPIHLNDIENSTSGEVTRTIFIQSLDPSDMAGYVSVQDRLSGVSGDSWGTGTMIPTGLQYAGAAVTTDNKNFYLLGGFSLTYLDQNLYYNTENGEWTLLNPMPTARNNFSAFYNPGNGLIYVPGGYASAYLDILERYDPSTNTWITLASMPIAKAGANGGIVGNKLYIFGGNGGDFSNETQIYDIATNTWSIGSTIPITSHRYGGNVTYENNIYLIGGYGENTFLRYDPTNDIWQSGPALNEARNSPAVAVSQDGILYVWGGGDEWAPIYNGEYYNLADWPNGSWTLIIDDNIPRSAIRSGHVCANGRLWIEGGAPYPYHNENQSWAGLECYWSVAVDIPWLGEEPISGSVPPSMTLESPGLLDVSITFSATYDVGIYQPGDYNANIVVAGNPRIDIPVTMTVLPGTNMGKVEGQIIDNCTGNALQGVYISFPNGDPITHTITDENGDYVFWLISGAYEISFSQFGYIDYVEIVNIEPGGTVRLDINLLPDRPCINLYPDTIEVWVITGTIIYTSPGGLWITNRGGQDLDFSIKEAEWLPPNRVAPPIEPTTLVDSIDLLSNSWIPSTPTQLLSAGVLIIQDFDPWGYSSIQVILNNNDIPYSIINSSQIPMIDFSQYRMIILPSVQGSTYNTTYNNNLGLFENYIDSGGIVLLNFADYSNSYPFRLLPFGGETDYMTERYNYVINPLHPIFLGVPNPYSGNSASHSYLWGLQPEDSILVTGGAAPGGNLIMIERTHGDGLLVAGGQTFEYGYANGESTGTILANMIPYYYHWRPVMDIPWVWEYPINGTISGGLSSESSMNINVMFTTLTTGTLPMPLGTYSATVLITNNVSIAGPQVLPVIMHIVEEYIPPTAFFTSNSPVCNGNPVLFTNTTIPGIPPTSWYLWDFGDGITSTVDSPAHLYDDIGTYTVSLDSCNDASCSMYQGLVSVTSLPDTSFTYKTTGLTVVFTDTTLNASTYLWEFGDGITSTLKDPVHTFSTPGSYNVVLTTFNDCGIDEARSTITVGNLSDLALFKDAFPEPVVTGGIITYTLLITNNGPDIATNVVLSDTLPTGVIFQSASAGCVEIGGVVTCHLGDLAQGESITATIYGIAPDSVGTITNEAMVWSDSTDSNVENNFALVNTTVLRITKLLHLPIIFKN